MRRAQTVGVKVNLKLCALTRNREMRADKGEGLIAKREFYPAFARRLLVG